MRRSVRVADSRQGGVLRRCSASYTESSLCQAAVSSGVEARVRPPSLAGVTSWWVRE